MNKCFWLIAPIARLLWRFFDPLDWARTRTRSQIWIRVGIRNSFLPLHLFQLLHRPQRDAKKPAKPIHLLREPHGNRRESRSRGRPHLAFDGRSIRVIGTPSRLNLSNGRRVRIEAKTSPLERVVFSVAK